MDKVEKFKNIVRGLEERSDVIIANLKLRFDDEVETCINSLEREFLCLELLVDKKVNESNADRVTTGLSYIAKYAMIGRLLLGDSENADMAELGNRMADLYARKNRDYGDSFSSSMDKYGFVVAMIRMGDKLNRLKSLMAKRGDGVVKDESMADTFIDMACYAVMTIMWAETQLEESYKGEIEEWDIQGGHVDEIPKSKAVAGDYAYIDGDSGFCHGGYCKIIDITTNYHPRTGKPFKVVVLNDEDVYRFDNGMCIKGAEAYRIISYARLKPGVKIKSNGL